MLDFKIGWISAEHQSEGSRAEMLSIQQEQQYQYTKVKRGQRSLFHSMCENIIVNAGLVCVSFAS